MKPKTFIIEFILLLAIYIATWFSISLFIGNTTLDINFHDTYFVIGRTVIVLQAFLMLITVIYLIKEGFYRYKRRLQNLVLVTANFLFLIILYPLLVFVYMMPAPEWTIYPPLSAISKIRPSVYQNNNMLFFIKQISPAIIIIFLLILVISAIITGKNWNTRKYE